VAAPEFFACSAACATVRQEQTRTFKVTNIELSPRVADPLVRMDWHDEGDDPAGFRAALIQNYELGKVIILENAQAA
jgi:hypothetical protein